MRVRHSTRRRHEDLRVVARGIEVTLADESFGDRFDVAVNHRKQTESGEEDDEALGGLKNCDGSDASEQGLSDDHYGFSVLAVAGVAMAEHLSRASCAVIL